MTPITINLPESLVESAQRLGKATARELSNVLVDTLEIVLPTFNNLPEISNYAEISHLLDSEVIELANLKMDAVQNQRLGELQAKGKNTGLTEAEGYFFTPLKLAHFVLKLITRLTISIFGRSVLSKN